MERTNGQKQADVFEATDYSNLNKSKLNTAIARRWLKWIYIYMYLINLFTQCFVYESKNNIKIARENNKNKKSVKFQGDTLRW